MKQVLPEIRIINAWLLREAASQHMNTLLGDGGPLRSDEEYQEIVDNYQQAWQPYEKQVLSSMCEVLNLTFRKNIIDAYIAPWFKAFSEPLVIGVRLEPDHFVDILTHELLHCLLTDNTSKPRDFMLLNEWQKLFDKNISFTALVHIPVHAVHKALYLDYLKEPDRLQRDMQTCKDRDATEYLIAWDYVEKHGYQEIIEKLKKSYSQK